MILDELWYLWIVMKLHINCTNKLACAGCTLEATGELPTYYKWWYKILLLIILIVDKVS